MSNRLIDETSPYLLQHAHNPVDWYPWGDEAFAKAREEDKPVLVSIGYASCHWCHVMERESFEDQQIADKMNESLVAIKVDREERPDIDAIYMSAMQHMHGHGGWPLNVFLLPDGRPFYGGTYFPPTRRAQMPSWPEVIDAVSDAYGRQRGAVLENARILTDALKAASEAEIPEEHIDNSILDQAYLHISELFDARYGGFGGAPKFPQSMPQEFLLRRYARTGEEHAREMVEISLKHMANGGIYDQLGGGFARYSTDEFWLVPHFEKMLYDNALLASLYVQAYQVTGNSSYKTIVCETLDYLLRDLRHPEGGFYSSQDADSEGVEGKYYVWGKSEIELVLGPNDTSVFGRYYGIEEIGNFEGRNILHVRDSLSAAASDLKMSVGDLESKLGHMRQALLRSRANRTPPPTDSKVLTSWNGLALRAFAEAAFVLDREDYLDIAVRNAEFLLSELWKNGRVLRTWKDGQARLNGYLEDYAFLINGLVSLHAASFSQRWLLEAKALADKMIELFWDETAGVFFDVGVDHEPLIVRPRDLFDNATPSGNSSAAEALLRLAAISGVEEYALRAERLLRGVVPFASRYSLGFGNWLRVIDLYLAERTEVVLVGDRGARDTRALLAVLRSRYRPTTTFLGIDPQDTFAFKTPLTEGRLDAEQAMAFVCHNYACDLPATDPELFAVQLDGLATNHDSVDGS